MLKHFGTQAVGLFCVAQGALAGSLTYGTVEQLLAGSVAVHDVLAETSDTDSFAFAENTPTSVNQAYSIEASLSGATIEMEGSFTSSFSSNGFAIEASALATVPNQGAFGGVLINGSLSGDASALVTFVISEPTEVMYSVSGLPFALFERIDVYESIVFIKQSNEIQSGQRLLAPGTYIMNAGFAFEDDDNAGGFFLANVSRAGFSLQVVPAPGGAAALLLAGAGLGYVRRRRSE